MAARDLLWTQANDQAVPTERRIALLQEAAEFCDVELDDSAGAIAAWRAHRELAPAETIARDALIRLYERTERWDDLVAAQEEMVGGIEDDGERADLFRKIVRIHRDERNGRINWSYILEQGEAVFSKQNRSSVDLKDKWRNIQNRRRKDLES